jgi:hypothetical protein
VKNITKKKNPTFSIFDKNESDVKRFSQICESLLQLGSISIGQLGIDRRIIDHPSCNGSFE